jgi:hypothetical protein
MVAQNPSLRIFISIHLYFFFSLQVVEEHWQNPQNIENFHLFTYIPLRAQEKPKTNFNWAWADQLSQGNINILILHKFNASFDRNDLIQMISFF